MPQFLNFQTLNHLTLIWVESETQRKTGWGQVTTLLGLLTFFGCLNASHYKLHYIPKCIFNKKQNSI